MISRQKLHQNGPDFSRLVWGAWRACESPETNSPEKLARLIETCLELGITSFDHADIYGGYKAEALFGEALKLVKAPRENIEIISKCDILINDRANLAGAPPAKYGIKHYNTSTAYMTQAVEASLKALGSDYLDLLLVHRPDPFMDADEAARGLRRLVESGKVRHIGVSNHSITQFELLQSRLDLPLVTNQIEVSVVETKAFYDGTLDQAQRLRASPMIWSPFGGGDLFSGTQFRELRAVLLRLAEENGAKDIGQMALAWLLAHPARMVPVLGTGRLDRLASYAAADKIKLDRISWFEILQAGEGREVP